MTRDQVVRVGLAGFGKIARIAHLPSLRAISGVQVTAIAERDTGTRTFADHYVPDAAVLPYWEGLLDRQDVDAIVICLPPAMHAAVATAALQHGKSVYVEKPLATTLDDARRAVAAAAAVSVPAMMGFNYRFHPLVRQMHELLAAGRIGTPIAVRSTFTSTGKDLPPWKRTRRDGGGALLDLGIHHADLVRYLADSPLVAMRGDISSRTVEGDTAFVQGETHNGVAWQGFFTIAGPAADRVEVIGDRGSMYLDRYAGVLDVRGRSVAHDRMGRLRQELANVRGAISRIGRPPGEPSYRVALAAFVDAHRQGRTVTPDFRDGFDSLAAMVAAEQAAESGSIVRVAAID